MQNIEEKRARLKQAIDQLKEDGVVAHIISEHLQVRLVIDDINITFDSDKGSKVIIKNDGIETDISDNCIVNSISMNSEFPVVNVVFKVKRATVMAKETQIIEKLTKRRSIAAQQNE